MHTWKTFFNLPTNHQCLRLRIRHRFQLSPSSQPSSEAIPRRQAPGQLSQKIQSYSLSPLKGPRRHQGSAPSAHVGAGAGVALLPPHGFHHSSSVTSFPSSGSNATGQLTIGRCARLRGCALKLRSCISCSSYGMRAPQIIQVSKALEVLWILLVNAFVKLSALVRSRRR